MTTRERFQRMYDHRDADRIPIIDSPWAGTLRRWHAEGMPEGVDWRDYFAIDKVEKIGVDITPRYEEKVIEDTDRYQIVTTKWGVTLKNFKELDSTPEFLDYKVTTPEVWEEAKRRMTLDDDRIPWQRLKDNYARWMAEDVLHMTHTDLKFEGDREVGPIAHARLNAMLRRRAAGDRLPDDGHVGVDRPHPQAVQRADALGGRARRLPDARRGELPGDVRRVAQRRHGLRLRDALLHAVVDHLLIVIQQLLPLLPGHRPGQAAQLLQKCPLIHGLPPPLRFCSMPAAAPATHPESRVCAARRPP